MLSGRYQLNDRQVFIHVKETEKSFSFRLLDRQSRYLDPPLDDFFKNGTGKILKSGSKHAICVWSDESFTLYPYRVGVPFLFHKIDF